MSTGKPVIHTYPIEKEPAVAYLQKYPNSLLINENDPLAENLQKLKYFMAEQPFEPVCYEGLEKLFYDNTPQAFVNVIDKL